jgi:benzoyl-CoA reductase/2-hydroxyglutaryl-CoA dehydratase subunit BcrC/BadD/HgdB
LSKFIEELEAWKMVTHALTKTGSEGETELATVLANANDEKLREILRCAREGDPFILSYFACVPEIYCAMDLPWYTGLASAFVGALLPGHTDEIDESETMFAKDYCTALKIGASRIERDVVPIPTAAIALLHPCDGTVVMHQVMAANENWSKVPIFGCDPPYWDDERSINYYIKEIKRMISFLEEHTDRRLDMDRLREVVDESNKQYALWLEYNQLRRAVPCPHGYGITVQAFASAEHVLVADPRGTQVFRDLVEDAEKLVKAKKGKVENEKIRIFWFDICPADLSFTLFPWLEEEWNAVVAMDMYGYTPYELIDTSSEEAMFWGLAERALCQTPMIRQARGSADNFLTDIERVVHDYKINCVIWPMHMGHKDGSAIVGLMREKCRELGVPFMSIGMDMFDPRYTTLDEMKGRFSEFFTAMGMG